MRRRPKFGVEAEIDALNDVQKFNDFGRLGEFRNDVFESFFLNLFDRFDDVFEKRATLKNDALSIENDDTLFEEFRDEFCLTIKRIGLDFLTLAEEDESRKNAFGRFGRFDPLLGGFTDA